MSETYYHTRLLLIRHGQARSTDGQYGPDTPLSPLGLLQAEALGKALAARPPIDALYSSPYPRAMETAAKIGSIVGQQVISDGRLSEFFVEPAPLASLQEHSYLKIWKSDHRGSADGETVEEFFARVGSFCDEACRTHRNRTIVLVTHAGTIAAVFRWAMGIPGDRPWTFVLEAGNGTISEIEMWPLGRIDGGPPRHAVLHRIGDAMHVKELESRI